MKNLATLAILVLLLPLKQLFAQDPFITKYDAIKRSERCFSITKDDNYQFGSIWWREKIDFSKDTTLRFIAYLGDKDASGADGIALVIHNDPQDTTEDKSQTWVANGRNFYVEGATGDRGGGLGYGDHSSIGGQPLDHISPSIAIEFDTWNNSDEQDGNSGQEENPSPYNGWDHTAVVYDGDMYNQQQIIEDNQGNTGRILPLLPIYDNDGDLLYGNNKNVEDDNCYTFELRWMVNEDQTQTLQLWVDDYIPEKATATALVMTHTDNMLQDVFDGTSLLRVGFTGSTGGSRNEQTICLLGDNETPTAVDDYSDTEKNTSVLVDIQANDIDPEDNFQNTPFITSDPMHGNAILFDSLGTYYIEYTPLQNFTGVDYLTYKTCDASSSKCYAKCSSATVTIYVGCTPFEVQAEQISPNYQCSDNLPDNGAAKATTIGLMGQIWSEYFPTNDITEDTGETAWTLTYDDCNSNDSQVSVRNNRLRLKDPGCEVTWSSNIIDISEYEDISISADLESTDELDASGSGVDYIYMYYTLDGGDLELFSKNGENIGAFDPLTASVSELNGNTLQVVIKAYTSRADEEIYIDNILVKAKGAPTAAKYEWFYGIVDDTPDYTGNTISGIPHGTYQVIATDTLTGCTSSIASVAIDSVGKPVPTVVVTPNTSCDTPNGQLEITEVNDNADAISDYTFEWLFGADSVIGNTALITKLDSGDYLLNITDNETDCLNELTYEVASDKDCSEESVITSSKYFPGDIQLFPNPANTTIQLKGLTKDSDYTIRIYALTGDKVLETKAQSIDISALDKGIYILTVYQQNEAIQSLRWIKE